MSPMIKTLHKFGYLLRSRMLLLRCLLQLGQILNLYICDKVQGILRYKCLSKYVHLQWPRGLRHELSSPARTQRSWV
jgi:hypothetical protein